jgi:hypothetical protein
MGGGGWDADTGDGAARPWARRYRRPYTVTGGRTRPTHHDLELETLVQSAAGAGSVPGELGRDQRSIALLCQEVVSVAEIAARLDLPLGVIRDQLGHSELGTTMRYLDHLAPAAAIKAMHERPVPVLELA